MGNILINEIENEIKSLIMQKNYPCIAALKSFHLNDYRVKSYSGMGQYIQRPKLRSELLAYLNRYLETKSTYFTFWAVFDDTAAATEDEFEKNLWSELSALTSEDTKHIDQDLRFSSNPEDKKFCFSLGGKAFFVVGLHPNSSRVSRRFPWPTLVFNVYEQFEQLAHKNLYKPMIEINRQRDVLFQGDINPMVRQHGDDWESIQFSGKTNPASWKCPFHFHQHQMVDAK